MSENNSQIEKNNVETWKNKGGERSPQPVCSIGHIESCKYLFLDESNIDVVETLVERFIADRT
jgi:hypothetical protein